MSEIIPKVSVIVPNYNHGRYLGQRIDSILQQTFADFEVIVLDDFSQDDSKAVIIGYAAKDSRIRYIFNEQNSGSVFKQWDLGLSQARGEYIWVAESDDFAEQTFLEKLLPILDQDSAITFAYTNSWVVDEANAIHGTTADWKQKYFADGHWDEDYAVDGKHELQCYLAVACTVNNASSVLFRRSSIEAVSGIDSSFRYTGDWLLYIKLSLKGRIAYTPECLSNYREHSANASKKSLADGSQLYERLKCFAYIYKVGKLPDAVINSMVERATREYVKLQYDLLRGNRNLNLLLTYIKGILAMSPSFYFRIQAASIKSLMSK